MVAAPDRRAFRETAPTCQRTGRRFLWPLLGLLAWAGTAAAADEAPVASARQVERGRLLLAQYQCGSCHAIPGVQAARGRVGTTLHHFGRRSYIAGEVPNRPAELARWIVAPAELVPGTLMPAMGVSPDDARDMAAYLLSLE